MRILYFHQHFTTPDGSGGTRSYEFARALLARGHQVTMVCGLNVRGGLDLPLDESLGLRRGNVDGINVIALPLAYSNRDSIAKRAWVFLRFAWRSARIALHHDYDLLFATSTPLTAAVPGILIKVIGRGKPFIFEVRDLWPELPRALGMRNPILLGMMSLIEWLAYHYADYCVALAPGIVDGIRHRAPVGRRIEMIPNGCDLDLFSPAKRGFLDLDGIAAGDFVAGFIGAHGKANGLDAVLDAALVLRNRGRTDIKIILIGDGNRKRALMARANRECLDNCLFLPVMKKTEIARITSSFNCGLQILADVPAFYYGTSPNKFFDYIAAGIPVLCNYPGWVAELISKHQCGVAVPPGNPAAFADSLCSLADSPKTAMEMGRNARSLAESTFDRARLADIFANLIESHEMVVLK